MEEKFAKIMKELNLNLDDPNLVETPKRIIKMYKHFFQNINKEFTDFKAFPNEPNYDQMIISDHIHFTSVCSHHFLPFKGKAYLIYIPDKLLVGLSKMARLVDHYSKRPQLQESLSHEIMNSFVENVKPKGFMIVMRAIHQCIACRGAYQYDNSGMITSAIYGSFTEGSAKQEALQLINISKGMI